VREVRAYAVTETSFHAVLSASLRVSPRRERALGQSAHRSQPEAQYL
jgi:hypothetical protein